MDTSMIVPVIQAGFQTQSNLLDSYAQRKYKDINPLYTGAIFDNDNISDALALANSNIYNFDKVNNLQNLMNVSSNLNQETQAVLTPSTTDMLAHTGSEYLNDISNLNFTGAFYHLGQNIYDVFTGGAKKRAEKINNAMLTAQEISTDNFYNQANTIQMRNNRLADINRVLAEGGSLDEQNGVTKFNVGGSHEQNPYEGIQQGIASDNQPNLVEEGEIKYKDYIYSNRLKPSKTLLKDNNLPEKYAGLTYAKMAEKLQKESENRPNDPVSKQTLEDWMSRLTNAQETQKAQIEQRRLAKALDSMSTEDKAALMSNIMQQQEGIDLSQPMYAEGGKIYIKPSKRGTFTAAAKKRGMGVQEFASKVLANKENYSPAMVRKANFARNAAHWHVKGGPNDVPFGAMGTGVQYLLGNYDPMTITMQNIAQRNADFANKMIAPTGLNLMFEPNYNNTDIELKAIANPTEVSEGATPKTQSVVMKSTTNNTKPKDTKKPEDTKGLKFNAEMLRYAPTIGAGIGALKAALQPVDYTLSNEYRKIASQLNPVAAPHIGGYRRYTPYDVNLGDAENLALEAAAIRANKGQNRATQAAQNIATINAFQKANAQRNLAAQQANEANKLAVDTYNLDIDQFNAQRDTQYDKLNQQILNNRLNMLAQAAQAADASRTARANMINTTGTNFFNQLGNVGQDEWNRNQMLIWLKNHPADAKAMGMDWLIEQNN